MKLYPLTQPKPSSLFSPSARMVILVQNCTQTSRPPNRLLLLILRCYICACMCVQIALFAGRRSSDRAYLLLQTWFCAHNLKSYIGSSSIFAFSHLSRIMEEEGLHKPEERIQQIGEPVLESRLPASWVHMPQHRLGTSATV